MAPRSAEIQDGGQDSLYKGDWLHTYCKDINKKSNRKDIDNRVPSFLQCHNYTLSTPRHSQSSKRPRSSPTGHTPHAPEKKHAATLIQDVGSEYTRKKWRKEETNFIINLAATTRLHSNAFWNTCAQELNEKFSLSRTGESCRLHFKRVKLNTSERGDCTSFLSGVSDITETLTVDVACQTDLTVPPERLQEAQREGQTREDQKQAGKPSISGQLLLNELRQMYTCDGKKDSNINDSINALLMTSNIDDVANIIYQDNILKRAMWSRFLSEVCENSRSMCEKRKSYLFHKDFHSLKSFTWESVTKEMVTDNSKLLQVLLAVSVPKKKLNSIKHAESLVKNLGLVYSILMKARWKDLSRLQRVVSMIMCDEKVPQKMYDRLQPMGVCTSHSVSGTVLDDISGHFNTELIDALKQGKRFRIVGDNVNFSVDVSHLRQSSQKHMEHWFGSAAIIQEISFDHLPTITPQMNLLSLPWDFFLPNEEDWRCLRRDYSMLIMRILVKHMSAFSVLSDALPKHLSQCESEDMKLKHKVIPLPVMAKNEQKYSEVIDVLDEYEGLVKEVHDKAGIPVTDDLRVHIGGDQLTRERFSGAKRLRSIGTPGSNTFIHLGLISFEFFHLQMALLSTIFKCLYNEKSTDTGTLGAERIRLGRKRADGKNVKNNYQDCKELATSLVDMYILEAACNFFHMEHVDSNPKEGVPNFAEMSTDDQVTWIYENIGKMVDRLVWPFAKEALDEITHPQPTHQRVTIIMPNGKTQDLLIPVKEKSNKATVNDEILLYAHNLLELGLLFKDLSDVIHFPNRKRMLSILKVVMLVFKGNSTKSKYALEILRLLFHQQARLSERMANESFYGCFVNTGGKLDTHIAADMAMEHLVGNVKGHIKALQSNKSEKTIKKRTAAFAGLSTVSANFDSDSGVVIRAHKHKTPSAENDEKILFENIHRLAPFSSQHGRSFASHQGLSKSLICRLTRHQLQSWISGHQVHLKNEQGQ